MVFFFKQNRKEKRLVLVFRGSAEPKDWLIDFRFLKTQAIGKGKDMLIHKGFYSKFFNDKVIMCLVNFLFNAYSQLDSPFIHRLSCQKNL